LKKKRIGGKEVGKEPREGRKGAGLPINRAEQWKEKKGQFVVSASLNRKKKGVRRELDQRLQVRTKKGSACLRKAIPRDGQGASRERNF